MAFIKYLRLVILSLATLLNLVIFSSSSFLNSKSVPKFHYSWMVFPFALSFVTLFVIPTLLVIGRTHAHRKGTKLSLISTTTIELPLTALIALLWFICAQIDITKFFGPFRHCNKGAGVGVIAQGLPVPGTNCHVVASVHGSEWLTVILLGSYLVIAGLVSLITLIRSGWKVLGVRVPDLLLSGHIAKA